MTISVHKLLIFRDEKLLTQALTHRSYINENPGESHNERLEFLGDALLNFLSGEYLYDRYPQRSEGEMTQWRSTLVDEKQLAKFALIVGLDLRMRLGKGTIQTGGCQNPNLLSSTFEAVVGAYYLDRDHDFASLRPLIADLFDSALLQGNSSYIDAKSRFQVWVQAKFENTLPRYVIDRIGGLDHAPEYLAKVLVKEKVYGEGKAFGKKEAEKKAAKNALMKLQQQELI